MRRAPDAAGYNNFFPRRLTDAFSPTAGRGTKRQLAIGVPFLDGIGGRLSELDNFMQPAAAFPTRAAKAVAEETAIGLTGRTPGLKLYEESDIIESDLVHGDIHPMFVPRPEAARQHFG